MRKRSLIAILSATTILVVVAYLAGRMQRVSADVQASRTATAVVGVEKDGADRPRPVADSGASGQLPPRDRPLRSVFADLQARAAAGDTAAATRLYRDLRLCGRLGGTEWSFDRVADELLDQKVDGADAQSMENYRVQLDAIEERKVIMRKFHGLCDGLDRDMQDAQLTSLQQAAKLGEPQARACYLARGPAYDARGMMRHPEWLQSYRSSVKSLVDSGLAAGDWKVVDILRSAYQPGADGPLAGVLGSDPVQYYRYLKLYRMGAPAHNIPDLDRQLAAAAAQLQPEQRADADLWAQTSYQRDFDGGDTTGSTMEGWDPCSFPYDPL